MENKIYYKNAYQKNFTSELLKQVQDESGQWYAVLKETAFYPTGGGQPHDTGKLNGVSVINVEDVEGEIRHYLEKRIDGSGEVAGEIDWERRFDHMQQHAGQHILSAAFEELFSFKTISFHLGKETLTIDLEIEELTEEQAAQAEELANSIILENRPIETKWVKEEDLIKYPLRKQPTVTSEIRLVIMPDFDYNGCGGTHPKSTSEVSAIKILDWERQKKKVRVQFVCGKRVRNQLGQKQKTVQELTRLLSAPEQDLVTAASRVLEAGKLLEKQLEEANAKLFVLEAKDLIGKAETVNGQPFVQGFFQDRSIQDLQKLARLLTAENEAAVMLLLSESEDRLQLVAATGNASDSNMKQLMGTLLPLIEGKGGGNDKMAQGGGRKLVSPEGLIDAAVEFLKQRI